MRALIIEDLEDEAKLISYIIEPLASEIIVRPRMAEALVDIGSGNPPEIITIDLGLPDSNRDFTINTRIPQIRGLAPDSLIIVITGLATDDSTKACLASGADAVFPKLEIMPVHGFMDRLQSLVLELMKRPKPRETNLRILETIAEKIAQRSLHLPIPAIKST